MSATGQLALLLLSQCTDLQIAIEIDDVVRDLGRKIELAVLDDDIAEARQQLADAKASLRLQREASIADQKQSQKRISEVRFFQFKKKSG
jgi:hypothetical protein